MKTNNYLTQIVASRCAPYPILDKDMYIREHCVRMLNRSIDMFRYEGLPESITERNLEIILQVWGYGVFPDYRKYAELKNTPYVFGEGATLGEKPDAYYMPTKAIVVSPYLSFSANMTIGEECEVIPNSSMYTGLLDIYRRYGTLLAENEISLRKAIIDSRNINIITAMSDNDRKAVEEYLKKIEAGEFAFIPSNDFMNKIALFATGEGKTEHLTDLIEVQQYLKASEFNEIGLNANYNMKREAINSYEAQMNNGALVPLIEDMLIQRQKAWDNINQKYKHNVKVDFAKTWKTNVEEIENDMEDIQEAIETKEGEADDETVQTA